MANGNISGGFGENVVFGRGNQPKTGLGGSQFGGNLFGGADSANALQKLLSQFGGGGGLFGLGDAATGGLFTAGSALLGGIGGLLGGKSEEEKRTEKVFNLAQNRLGQDVFDPQQLVAEFERANFDRNNLMAENINRTLGLDTGVGQGALANQRQSQLAQFVLDAKVQNDVLKSRNDNMLLQLMAGLSRG